jgi:lipoprotein-anchoring transpeptidase ErfK/SrfK
MGKIKKFINIILILLAVLTMVVFAENIIPLNETYGISKNQVDDVDKEYEEIIVDTVAVKDSNIYPDMSLDKKPSEQKTDYAIYEKAIGSESKENNPSDSGINYRGIEGSKKQEESVGAGLIGVALSYYNSFSAKDKNIEDEPAAGDAGDIDFGDVENIKVEVDLESQRVIIFYRGRAVREMTCSGGKFESPTPTGEFTTLQKIEYAWVDRFDMGAYYWVRFFEDYLFHSVPFNENGEMMTEELDKLGEPASHGCIRLSLDDAKWFYETVPLGVAVLIH